MKPTEMTSSLFYPNGMEVKMTSRITKAGLAIFCTYISGVDRALSEKVTKIIRDITYTRMDGETLLFTYGGDYRDLDTALAVLDNLRLFVEEL